MSNKRLITSLKRLFNKEYGFTLIEILVVISILGILAAVAIPNIVGLMDEGETEAVATELHNVQLAVNAAMAEAKAATVNASELTEDYTIAKSDGSGNVSIWSYMIGGYTSLEYGPYSIASDGHVTRP